MVSYVFSLAPFQAKLGILLLVVQMGILTPTASPHPGGSPLFPPGTNVSPTSGNQAGPPASQPPPPPPPGFARVNAAKTFNPNAPVYQTIDGKLFCLSFPSFIFQLRCSTNNFLSLVDKAICVHWLNMSMKCHVIMRFPL